MLIPITLPALLLTLASAQKVTAQARVTLTAKVVVTATPAPAPAPLPVDGGVSASACPVFERCLSDVQTTLDATCSPLGNKTSFDQCQCIFAKSLNLCYATCPDDAAVQAAGVAQSSTVSKLCAAASLNPDHLPTVAPWQTVFSPTPTPTLPPPTTTIAVTPVMSVSNTTASAKITATIPLANSVGAITTGPSSTIPPLGPDAASSGGDAAQRGMRRATTTRSRFLPLFAVLFFGVLSGVA
ncbi:hypothetical protein HDU87_001639 [Geranomyces variabilis]|uniref:Uncharacterized protein n=1 Tax=Geranomyces variabilis TaxID=109894 RepID=A0AAD5TMY4_9FUNG|nr:hypothetical protein HDU87_001639 [Geranomyces variabilis]